MSQKLLWPLSILFAIFLLAFHPTLGAAELSTGLGQVNFTITDHIIFSNEQDERLPEGTLNNIFLHEDFVRAEVGNYAADIQFTNKYSSQFSNPGDAFTLEKKTLSAEWESWELALGDSHHELGKGIALSLYRDDAFGINYTLEGVSVKFRPSFGEVSVFGGQVNSLKNPVYINPVSDPLGDNRLWLAGGAIKARPNADIEIGSHYFIALNEPPEEMIRHFNRFWNTVGVTYSHANVVPNTDLYVEGNVLLPSRLRGRDYVREPTGFGSYASLSWTKSGWNVVLEGKDYRDYEFEFRRPPSLEEDIVETDHPENVFGSRLRVEKSNFREKTKVYGSYLTGWDRVVDVPIHHGVVGGKYKNLELSGGYRSLPSYNNMIHGAMKLKIPTFKHQSLELNGLKQFSNLNLDSTPTQEDRNRLNLTYTFSRKWNATLGYEYIPTNLAASDHHFVNMGTEVVLGSLVARAFVGRRSGGTICSGGVCRRVPPYTGAMAETQYTF